MTCLSLIVAVSEDLISVLKEEINNELDPQRREDLRLRLSFEEVSLRYLIHGKQEDLAKREDLRAKMEAYMASRDSLKTSLFREEARA